MPPIGDPLAFDGAAMIAALETGRQVIEEKFLAGGDVLEQAIGGIAAMTAALDELTAAIGPAAIAQTTAQLNGAAATLLALPAQQAIRSTALATLAARRTDLAVHIAEMRGCLAYMWAFAMNIKITARGIADHDAGLDVFAQDISDRIDAGRAEVDQLDHGITALQSELAAAAARAAALDTHCAATIPAVPDRLLAAAARMAAHRGQIGEAIAQAAALAHDVRQKIHRMLSALQVGDSTRQRIEHVQAGLTMLAAAGAELAPPRAADLRAPMAALLAAQLDAAQQDFDAQVVQIAAGLQSLGQDAAALLCLGDLAAGQDGGSSSGLLRALEQQVEDAVSLATIIETAATLAGVTGRTAGLAAGSLAEKLEAIQLIQSDVLFMALNTTLKSARIGESGRPLRIIANELRAHADELDAAATACVTVIQILAQAASALSGTTAPAGQTAEDPEPAAQSNAAETLTAAMRRLRDGGDLSDRNTETLTAHGKTLTEMLGRSAIELDLQQAIGGALAKAKSELSALAAPAAPCSPDLQDTVAALFTKLHALYTMAQERDTHAAIATTWSIPMPPAAPPQPAADELEDALF